MKPIILNLHPSIYEMKGSESEYRLVYEPEPDHILIDAATGRDLFGPDHYVLPPSRPLSSSENITQAPPLSEESWEQRLGIDMNRYVLEKCSDDEERITRIYQLKTQEEEEVERDPLSAEGYMERKWGDKLRFFRKTSIMVQVEKSTGRLVGYHHTGCGEEGSPALNRAECWEVAERFCGWYSRTIRSISNCKWMPRTRGKRSGPGNFSTCRFISAASPFISNG
ncbi:hypothetical protein HMSSN036_51030 [Paenibacillus macerans]|nr:hypothetical protein HMSSN036_51030 [Paenibacillus macerans]